MIRSLVSFVLVGLLAVVGGWAGWAMYDLAAIYADPADPELDTFIAFGLPVVAVLALIVALASAAVAVAGARPRRLVLVVCAGLLAVSTVGILVGNHLGVEAKRVETGVRASSSSHLSE